MTTDPFARWRESYRHLPGLLPSREKLAALQPATLVTVRADVLLQLVVQAENHDAPCEHTDDAASDAPLADFAYRERVPGRPDRLEAK